MKRTTPYGLGWQPDLPDLRDKTFAKAVDNLDEADKKPARPPAKTEKPPRVGLRNEGNPWQLPVEARHTYEGWQKSAGALENHLQGLEKKLTTKLAKAKKQAFGSGAKRETILLSEPPKESLSAVDLRPFMSPVEQQETIGSCTAHAVMGLIEYLQIVSRGDYVDGSRLFLYKATRNLLQWTGDTGAYIRDTIKAVRLFGVCPEMYWNYDVGQFDNEPSPFCYAFASNYKALRYYRLSSLEEIKRSLSQGYPVAFGFTCFESLFTESVNRTGRIPYPTSKEKVVGGHAVLAVGYNDTDSSDDAPDSCPPQHVIIRNSWGGWGQRGYGFLPFKFFESHEEQGKTIAPLADDFWTMTQMDILESDQVSAAPFTMGDGNPVQGGGGGGGVQ